MEILLLEPYGAGSHAAWAAEYAAHSRHRVEVMAMGGQHWKWRMHGGAVTLARRFLASGRRPDLLLASDMLDLTTFLGLTRELTSATAVAVYFHENQLTYPWSPTDADPGRQRDAHYSFINYTSALAADAVLFNSDYHRRSFLGELPGFLTSFPDANELGSVQAIAAKSRTLPLGLDLQRLNAHRPAARRAKRPPLLLWNHRWEYDKNPEEFFRALFVLQEQGVDFEVAVLGESYRKKPAIFAEARKRLGDRVIHWGYAENFAEYAAWLWRADILPVTSIHDFFGASVVQAMYCDCTPLLPERLAYPEHVPQAEQGGFFYRDFEDLVRRLIRLCREGAQARKEKIRPMVARYDWGTIGASYDRLFEELVSAAGPQGRGRPQVSGVL